MNVNINYTKEEIKTYLKIKANKIKEANQDPSIVISPNKKAITVFSKPIIKSSNNNSNNNKKTEYEIDKIFTETDEYSYIYEEITLNCISDASTGKNYCYIAYGETSGEKHSIIFGGKNSHINLNERGLFPRLLEALLSNETITISYSIVCINNNKLIDLSKYISLIDKIPSLTQEELLSKSIEIKQSPEVINQIDQIVINDYKDFITSLETFNSLFSHLYLIEPDSDCDLFSCSDFVYVIYIKDNNNANSNTGTNSLISTITFCELAGNEMKTTQISSPKVILRNSMKNTRAIINRTHTIESLKKTIRNFTKVKSFNKHNRINNFQVENSKLLLVLQRLCFSIPLTSYIAIGSIDFNIQSNSNETLQFLFDLRKIALERQASGLLSMTNIEEVNTKDLIYKLQIKCKEQEMEISELKIQLINSDERREKYKKMYNIQIDKLKSLFAFEGDVNMLLGGNNNTKEARNTRKISNALSNLEYENNKNEALTKEIVNLKKEITSLKNSNEVLRSDQSMLTFIHQNKEESQSEQKRLRINLDNYNIINKLKEENEKLVLLNKEYKKEIESKFNVIQSFNTQINTKQNDGMSKEAMRVEIQKEFEEKYKEEYKLLHLRYNKEIEIINKKNDSLVKLKDDYISKHNVDYNEIIVSPKKSIERYIKEMIYLYEIILLLVHNYRKEFGWKCTEKISPIYYNHFINSRDAYLKHVDSIETWVNMVNFPITIRECNTKKGKLIKKGLYDELNNETIKLNRSIEVKKEDSNNDDDNSSKYTQKLIKENQTLRNKIRELNELIDGNEGKWLTREKDKLVIGNTQLAKKLEEIVNENQKNKMIISANERYVNKLNAENLMMRTALNKKTLADSLNYHGSTLISLRTRNMKSEKLNKARSGDDIIAPNIFKRPNTGSLK